MNIIRASRALRALNDKVRLLSKRRENVKDKSAWDEYYGDELGVLLRQQAALATELMGALVKQGQFDHADMRNTEAASREYHEQ